MNTVNEIEQAIRQLSPEELAEFRVWFAEFNTLRDATNRIDAIEQKALRKLMEKQDTNDIDLESQGIDRAQAHILRSSLATFSDDWDSPEMSIYDNYDAAKDSVQAR